MGIFNSCKKQSSDQSVPSNETLVRNLKEDPVFYKLRLQLFQLPAQGGSLVNSSRSGEVTRELSRSAFEHHMQRATRESDPVSQQIVAEFTGYSSFQLFLTSYLSLQETYHALVRKYPMHQLTIKEWILLLGEPSNQQHNLQNGTDDGIPVVSSSISGLCEEILRTCKNNALAVYSLEASGCTSLGALGPTPPGVILFSACELFALYHLKQMQRMCNLEYQKCLEKK